MSNNAATAATSRKSIERIRRGTGHSYRLDGKPVDGVTTLIGRGMPKPALPGWAAKCVARWVADAEPDDLQALRLLGRDGMIDALKRIPWTERDQAAVRGTSVHLLAEKLLKGEKVDVPDELAGHVDGAVRFMDQWQAIPVLTETTVASRKYRYCGTFDAVVDLPGGQRAMIDYKTSASGIWPETALQMSAYWFADVFVDQTGAECDMNVLDLDSAYAVNLRADGFDVVPVTVDMSVFRAFLQVAAVARMIDVASTWIGEPEQAWSAVKP